MSPLHPTTRLIAASALLMLAACGGGGGDADAPAVPAGPAPAPTATPAPTPSTAATPAPTATPSPTPTPTPVAKTETARFLTQASFGPTLEEIDALQAQNSFDAWLQAQRALAPTLQLPLLIAQKEQGMALQKLHRVEAWWRNALTAPDQLRQRMAFALSEILVVSDDDTTLAGQPEGMAYYYDVLTLHALGNYRDLLEAVTLSPAMGHYLGMFRNRKPDPVLGIRADENYAREIMQLFTIGLVELNPDGTAVIDGSGAPVPSYTQADVENLARAFTGWAWTAGKLGDNSQPNWTAPLQPDDRYHDSDAKRIVGDVEVPAGMSAQEELDFVLDALFEHPNVGPFVGKQLIQRLVTSNPTPAYVARVAKVFADNGKGVRGDLYAVARAILLDPEARDGHRTMPRRFGKVREPLLRVTALWRAFDARMIEDRFVYAEPERAFSQAPLRAPSVFNFFRPDYAPAGLLADAGMLAPELALADDSTLNLSANVLAYMAYWYRHSGGATITEPGYFLLDYRDWEALTGDPQALLDRLDLLLMSGQMPDLMRSELAAHLAGTTTWQLPAQPVAEAVMLIVTSPQFAVQR